MIRSLATIIIVMTAIAFLAGCTTTATLPAPGATPGLAKKKIEKGITTQEEIPEELKKLNATVAEFPSLDEESLKYIANQTGGEYFKVTNITSLEEALKHSIEVKEVTIDPTFYLLIAAMSLLVLEWALEITRFRVIP